jgi:hypothetical protein
MSCWLLLLQDPGQFDPKWEDLVRLAASRVAHQALEDMTTAPRGKLLVIPLAGDSGEKRSIVTDELRRTLLSSGKFTAVESNTIDKILEWLGMKGKIHEITAMEQAVQAGEAAEADYVLFGRTEIDSRFIKDRLDVSLHFRIVNVKTKLGFFIGSYTTREEASIFSPTHWKVKIREIRPFWRLLLWTVVMLGLPFVVIAFKEAAAGSRPLLPVMMVVAFTAIDVFVCFALLGFDIDSVVTAGAFVIAMVVSLFWNLFVLSRIAQMSKDGN